MEGWKGFEVVTGNIEDEGEGSHAGCGGGEEVRGEETTESSVSRKAKQRDLD